MKTITYDEEKWKLVPIEPITEMIDAAERLNWADEDVRGNLINQWNAMLAFSPTPPTEHVDGAVPVAWMREDFPGMFITNEQKANSLHGLSNFSIPLYTAPTPPTKSEPSKEESDLETMQIAIERAYLAGAECQSTYQQLVSGTSFWSQSYINENIERYVTNAIEPSKSEEAKG